MFVVIGLIIDWIEVDALHGPAQFRLGFRAPEASARPDQDKLIWRGRIASQVFDANGVID